MAKLTSAQRRALPDSMFGLPSERRFPLVDKRHVLLAIRYFGTCDVKKRKELASNINKFAKEYEMKINVSRGTAFKPYADKTILQEGSTLITEATIPEDVNFILRNKCSGIKRPSDKVGGVEINSAITVAFKSIMQDCFDREYYLNGNSDADEINSIKDFAYDTDLNICYDITRKFVYGSSADEYTKLKSLTDPTIFINAMDRVKELLPNNDNIDSLIANMKHIAERSPRFTDIEDFFFKVGDIDFDKEFNSSMEKPVPVFDKKTENVNFDESIASAIDNWHMNTLNYAVQSAILKKNGFPDEYWRESNQNAKFDIIVRYLYDKKIVSGYFIDCRDYKYVAMNGDVFVMTLAVPVSENKSCVILTKIVDSQKPEYYANIIEETMRTGDISKVIIRRIIINQNPKPPVQNVRSCELKSKVAALEGISISKDGDISFDLSISKSYMDKYSACHKLLIEDEKNKNYESMKHNLAYLFAMISTIEDKYVGKDKDVDKTSDDYKDAIKARAFAINDFKRCLEIVQRAEPRFNFMKFYTDNKYDKKIYTIKRKTLLGLKSLFKIIML